MRRILRKTSVVVASTVLTVALLLAAVRSSHSRDGVAFGWPCEFTIESWNGKLLVRSDTRGAPPRYVRFEHSRTDYRIERPHHGDWWWPVVCISRRFFLFRLPYLYLIALAAIPPAVWLCRVPRRRRLKRLSRGHCPNCDYDLRRTPGTCSECGFVVKEFPTR